ncbi:FkbM family methyltransferase [Runella defluvii]|uniref:FkbM family methyltransferase n=1 Tax=Runella defluvii TaxID=370973 RepID=A0A7W6ENM8_9BACT|nr:FkbM family methyltransferase [Runella defluvii]MBB3836417.1 FkbM family methyltransferase [Runella defluvii]
MKKLKRTIRKIIDRVQYTRINSSEVIGNFQADWCIDTASLQKSPILFSGGAGNDISFEQLFVEKFDGCVYLYDPSPTGRKTFKEYNGPNKITYHAKALGKTNMGVLMAKPQDPQEGSWTILQSSNGNYEEFKSVSLVDEILRYGLSYVDVVKLDIEGFEYDVLDDLLESSIEVRQILVEFHDFFDGISKWKSLKMRLKLRKKGYVCFHKSRYDFSFIKR